MVTSAANVQRGNIVWHDRFMRGYRRTLIPISPRPALGVNTS
jgi:hypothetical protein